MSSMRKSYRREMGDVWIGAVLVLNIKISHDLHGGDRVVETGDQGN